MRFVCVCVFGNSVARSLTHTHRYLGDDVDLNDLITEYEKLPDEVAEEREVDTEVRALLRRCAFCSSPCD